MTYTHSPRPTFDGPAQIPYEKVTRHLWGDPESGEVADWIYVSNEKIHQLIFGLPPGGSFHHSEQYRTVFAADELLFVLRGNMIIANPKTGEVHLVKTGEALFFRRDTWHHCFSASEEPLRVLEYFAPPPSQGTSGAYARSQANLTEIRYTQDTWLGKWPMAQEEANRKFTMRVLREQDILWRLEGIENPILTGIYISTEHLTAGRLDLQAGQHSAVQTHQGDESLYLLSGKLNVRILDGSAQSWFELKPGDGFYIPEGIPHQYYNVESEPVTLLFGVAPSYQAQADPRTP